MPEEREKNDVADPRKDPGRAIADDERRREAEEQARRRKQGSGERDIEKQIEDLPAAPGQ